MKHFKFKKGILACLLSLALVVSCFTVGARAEEAATPTKSTAVAAEYNATTDSVTASSNAYVYVLKAASGNKIKAGTAAKAQMEKGAVKISDLGIKGTKSDVFLYVCDKEIEVEETVSANLTIKGNASKVVGVVDYTQADYPGSAKVLSAYYVDKATKKQVAIASTSLYWSADQEKWYLANSLTQSDRKNSKGDTLADGFLGNDLAGMLETGGTIYIKQVGTSGASGTAQFGSAVTKLKIAKQAKAPKAKVDVSKDTIAIKNGFDFALAIKNPDTKEYEVVKWFTILPVLKTATVSSEGESIVGGVIGTGNDAKQTAYKPLDKKDTNAGKVVKNEGDENYYYSSTKYKFKALSNDKLFEIIMNDLGIESASELNQLDYKIAVRKSATEKKPASAYTLVDIKLQAEAPIVYTESNVKGQFLVASADEFTKKGIALGEIAAFAGYTGTGADTAVATSGFDSTFKITEASDSIKERDEGSTFEYTVVSTVDYFATGDAAIDWTTVKWKKLDTSKLKITEKLSGKYKTVKGTKKTASLKDTASSEIKQTGEEAVTETDAYGRTVIKDDAIKAGTKSLLLIRRQGEKSDVKRASEEIILYVAKENKKYNLYSTVSNGAMADKYTVAIFKYDSAKDGYYRDESIEAITGWSQKTNTGIKLDALTGADYWKISSVSASGEATLATADGSKYIAATAKIEAGNDTDEVQKGDYQIAIGANNDVNFDSTTVNIAIREYANIKVVGIASDSGEAVGTAKALGSVKAGKINSDTNVTAYADGTTITISLSGESTLVPAGYIAENGKTIGVSAASGEGFSDFAYVAGTPNKVTVKVDKADEIEVKVVQPVVKVYKITFDLNKPADLTSTATAPEATLTDGTKKISLPTATIKGTKPGATEGADPVSWKVNGWAKSKDATSADVTDETTYNADTTLYAVWGTK
jgi:hypothetical protein